MRRTWLTHVSYYRVAIIEYSFVYFTDWHKAAKEAESRNQAE